MASLIRQGGYRHLTQVGAKGTGADAAREVLGQLLITSA